jgi:hypothetical protein
MDLRYFSYLAAECSLLAAAVRRLRDRVFARDTQSTSKAL